MVDIQFLFFPTDKPTPPLGPLEILEASSDCVEIKWRSPKDDGGSPITNYILERNQIGRNTWKKLGQIPGEAYYRDVDVEHGRKYCYRIRAETVEGISDKMETEDVQAGTKGNSSTFQVFQQWSTWRFLYKGGMLQYTLFLHKC